MAVNIKPLEDKILVQANAAETTTASGLVIPDTAKEKPQEGTVVAVGPGRWDEDGEKRIPLDVAEGDTVIYSKYGGTEIKYNGEEYLILSGARRAGCRCNSSSVRTSCNRPGDPRVRARAISRAVCATES